MPGLHFSVRPTGAGSLAGKIGVKGGTYATPQATRNAA
jgi:hypothetical protein